MSFDPAPSTWFGGGYAVASNAAKFNTDTAGSNKLLLQLTDALADPTTGDIRSVMMAMSESFFQAWQAQVSADRPTKMTIARSVTGSGSSVVYTYTFKFTVDPTTVVVDPE